MKRDIFEICDLWENLKKTKKPILLYGMGDGADKVLDVCSSKGIEVSGVFASDDFAKHKIFRGFDVSPLSETLVKFEDPIILLSFASCLDDVMNNVKSIALKYELYCPDVPVFGTGLFDRKFVFENFDHFNEVYSSLSDDLSRSNYVNLILGKMTGNIDYLVSAETPVAEAYQNIIKPSAIDNVDKLSDKESVLKSLKTIKEELENIKAEIKQYEEDVIFESTYITKELLEKEEEAYERRRRDSECHVW